MLFKSYQVDNILNQQLQQLQNFKLKSPFDNSEFDKILINN